MKAAKYKGINKIAAEDISQSITYRSLIAAVYILSQKFAQLLKGEKNIGVLLPNSIGHIITLFALFYNGKTPALLNFSAGIQNNLDCTEAAELKTILTSRVFIEKGGFRNLTDQLASRYKVLYLEDIKTPRPEY